MKVTFKTAIAFLWSVFSAFISPAWIGLSYMCMTGHGKGYGYDLGSEADISVAIGVLGFILWLGLVLLPFIWLCRRFYKAGKRLLAVPLGGFILFALSGILWMGGFEEFLYAFGF